MMVPDFFRKEKCDRCGGLLVSRTMSWFTSETICMECAGKEDELKAMLRALGKDPRTLEGCGYMPGLPKEKEE